MAAPVSRTADIGASPVPSPACRHPTPCGLCAPPFLVSRLACLPHTNRQPGADRMIRVARFAAGSSRPRKLVTFQRLCAREPELSTESPVRPQDLARGRGPERAL